MLSLPVFHEGVEVENRVISAATLSPSDAAGQEVVERTVQRVVVARAWTPCNAAVQYCLENFGFQPLGRKHIISVLASEDG